MIEGKKSVAINAMPYDNEMIKDETSNSMTLFDVFFMHQWKRRESINSETGKIHVRNEAEMMVRK